MSIFWGNGKKKESTFALEFIKPVKMKSYTLQGVWSNTKSTPVGVNKAGSRLYLTFVVVSICVITLLLA